MKLKIGLLCIFLVAGIVPVILLHHESVGAGEVVHDFIRGPKLTAQFRGSTDLVNTSFYFAGVTNDKVFLGHNGRPSVLFELSAREESPLLELPVDKSIRVRASKFVVDSNAVFLIDLISFRVFRGDLPEMRLQKADFDTTFFAEAVPISDTTVVTRTFDKRSGMYVLARQSERESRRVARSVLIKQIDGLFCTDGVLHFNRHVNKLIYVYFYRNEFIIMNPSLEVVYRGRTIDPIDTARIAVRRISTENSFVLASPPLVVNSRSDSDAENLYIYSKVRARNDDEGPEVSASVIDVYELSYGTYRYSIVIPAFQGHLVREFRVNAGELFALQGPYLVRWTIAQDQN